MTLEEKVGQLTHYADALERLGIPEYNWWNECLHGVARSGKATVFPQAIGMAATFDRDMMFRMADVTSTEARASTTERKSCFSSVVSTTERTFQPPASAACLRLGTISSIPADAGRLDDDLEGAGGDGTGRER